MFEQNQSNSSMNSGIRIFTLGQFKIQLNNGDLCNISSRSNKLWNLFKFLLINRNKDVHPEIILEYLYPDEDYEDPQNTVHNMIYRLRKLMTNVGLNDKSGISITYSNGCYKLNFQDSIWLDIDAFEKYTKNAESIRSIDALNAIDYYKSAVEMYEGELFPELVFEDWIIPKRTYFSKLYIQNILKLSELYNSRHLHDLIVQAAQSALLIEPYEEEIHMILVENLLKMGKYKEAKLHYEETVKVFEKQYGITPTKEMQKIEQLLKNDSMAVNNRRNTNLRIVSDEEGKGAFYCEYRDFYAIYSLEKRKSERSGCAICPVSIEFSNDKNIYRSNSFKNKVVDQFKKTLLNSLRRGDTFTLVNKTQFLILLPDLEYNQVKSVVERVINKFKSDEAFKDINIELDACVSLGQKSS